MNSIRVSNLRSLKDTGTIQIKPLTLLVGSNSSGKSTFLRIFPLLKQSIETKTLSGLLLNEGDVNFGFFDEALHKDAEPAELKLEFGVSTAKIPYYLVHQNPPIRSDLLIRCEITYAKKSKDSRYPFPKKIKVSLIHEESEDSLEISAGEDGHVHSLTVNGQELQPLEPHLELRIGRKIIPTILRTSKEGDEEDEFSMLYEPEEDILFKRQLIQKTSRLFHGRTLDPRRIAILNSITLGSSQQMLDSMKTIEAVDSWHHNISSLEEKDAYFIELRNLLLAKSIRDILLIVSHDVSDFATSTHYFAPVRARAERDYLSRDVAVSNVDPAGINVAMVLSSLSRHELTQFREWMTTNFGFEIYPKAVGDGARISLRMKEANSSEETFNLADIGFGFSQMLPFLVQIWLLTLREPQTQKNKRAIVRRRRNSSEFLFAIEQPELHLHPALQAKITDIFAITTALAKRESISVKFVLETHSPSIIERVGALIEGGYLKKEDVQVLIFEKSKAEMNTTFVRATEFDEQGVLIDWPFGFLTAPNEPMPPPIPN